jgi:hypothetical protein
MNRHTSRSAFSRFFQCWYGLCICLLISACGGGGGTVGLPTGTNLYSSAPSAVTVANGTTISYAIGGGTPTYTAASSNKDVASVTVTGNNVNITGVGAAGGSAAISVTDAAGAAISINVTVTAAPGPTINPPGLLFTTAGGLVTVAPGASATFGIGGGQAPYALSSSNSAVANATGSGTNFTVNGVGAGAAQIVVTDAVGTSINLAVTVGSGTPTPLYATAPSAVTVAVGASASYAVGGGKPAYAISSSNSSVAKVAASGSDFLITGVAAGNAQLSIVDTAGTALSIDVTVGAGGTTTALFTTAPAAITLQPGVTGSYAIGGGKPVYSVSTSNAAVAQVAINGNSFIITGIATGSAGVKVMDAAGASEQIAVTVPPTATATALFTTAPSQVAIGTGASVSFAVSGGSGAYQVSSSAPGVAGASLNGSTLIVSALAAGTAKVTLTDSAAATVQIDVTVTQTAPSVLAVLPGSASGNVGDTLTFLVSGGTPGYTVIINNTSIASVTAPSVGNGGAFSVSLLNVGSTLATITDALGQTFSLPITANQTSTTLRLSPSALLLGENDATPITLNIFGGTGPYRAFTSDQTLSAVSTSGATLTITTGSNGKRCINPITEAGTYIPNGTFDVTITVLDNQGASATSVLTIKDNGAGLNAGCP